MKKLRILSLVMAIAMVAIGLISCGGEVVSAKVRLAVIKIDINGKKELLCPVMESEIKGTTDNPPTVLQATREILEENSIQYSVDESIGGGHITSIKSQKERSSNGVITGWTFKLNGVEVKELASEASVKDGDYIVYYLESWTNSEAVDDPDASDEATETEIETEEPEVEEEETENGD